MSKSKFKVFRPKCLMDYAYYLYGNIKKMPSGCWHFIGRKTTITGGYGHMQFKKGRELTHRVSWMIANNWNEIPSDKYICHKCDNPICCNPSHLFIGTPKDNIEDAMKKGRKKYESGDGATSSKVNFKLASLIRRLREIKIPCKKVASMFNISQSLVYAIEHKKSWHVPGPVKI